MLKGPPARLPARPRSQHPLAANLPPRMPTHPHGRAGAWAHGCFSCAPTPRFPCFYPGPPQLTAPLVPLLLIATICSPGANRTATRYTPDPPPRPRHLALPSLCVPACTLHTCCHLFLQTVYRRRSHCASSGLRCRAGHALISSNSSRPRRVPCMPLPHACTAAAHILSGVPPLASAARPSVGTSSA